MRVKCVINIDYLFACHTIYTRIEYQCKFTIVLIVYGVPLGTKISKGVHIISNCRRKCQTATKNIKTHTHDSKPTQKISNCPRNNNKITSKMYVTEPRYNEPRYDEILDITNTIRQPRRKIYFDITNKCQHARDNYKR